MRVFPLSISLLSLPLTSSAPPVSRPRARLLHFVLRPLYFVARVIRAAAEPSVPFVGAAVVDFGWEGDEGHGCYGGR